MRQPVIVTQNVGVIAYLYTLSAEEPGMRSPSAPSPPLHGLEVVVVVAGDGLFLLPSLSSEPGLQEIVENVQRT